MSVKVMRCWLFVTPDKCAFYDRDFIIELFGEGSPRDFFRGIIYHGIGLVCANFSSAVFFYLALAGKTGAWKG